MTRLAALLLVLLTACSSSTSVGSKDNTNFTDKGNGRLGEVTTAPAPVTTPPKPRTTTPAPVVRTTTPAPVRTTHAPPPPTHPQPAPGFTVKIVATGQGYDPFRFAVAKGTVVTVVNTTSAGRTFTSDKPGVFDSKTIAPGKSWTWTANVAGVFNFHDQTRPFANGQVEVRG